MNGPTNSVLDPFLNFINKLDVKHKYFNFLPPVFLIDYTTQSQK